MKKILAVVLLGCFMGCSSSTAPTPYDPTHFYGLLGAWKSDRPVVDSNYLILHIYSLLSGPTRSQIVIDYSNVDSTYWVDEGTAAPPSTPGAYLYAAKDGQQIGDLNSPIDSVDISWRSGNIHGFPSGDTLKCKFPAWSPNVTAFNLIRISEPDSVRQ